MEIGYVALQQAGRERGGGWKGGRGEGERGKGRKDVKVLSSSSKSLPEV